MGLRSGLYAGQSSSSTLISTNNFCMDLALCTGALSCWNRKGPSPNCYHKVGCTESSRMSWNVVVLRFPFTGTKGPRLNHEKQPQTIIPPPPNITVGTMQLGLWRSPGIHQTGAAITAEIWKTHLLERWHPMTVPHWKSLSTSVRPFYWTCLSMEIAWCEQHFIHLSAMGLAEIAKSTSFKGCPHTFVYMVYIITSQIHNMKELSIPTHYFAFNVSESCWLCFKW
jgi:hypothetical protein